MSADGNFHHICLTFKGDRNYLHGTDIIPALLDLSGPVRDLSVQFYHMTSHVLVARSIAESQLAELRKSKKLCVLMSYEKSSQGRGIIAVTEDLSQKVEMSRPYDEASVVQSTTCSGNAISQQSSATGTFFERVVALNKMLLNELEGKSSWLFSGIDLTQVPDDSTSLSIEVTNKIGRRIYKSSITADGNFLGSIMFSGVTKS